MKYIHIKKNTSKIKYKELADSSYNVIPYYDVEVPDDYILKGDNITFTLNTSLTPEEEFQEGLIKTLSDGSFNIGISELQSYKNKKLKEYSQMSLVKRRKFLTDYELINASMDIYDENIKSNYKKTIKAFRTEYYRIKDIVDVAIDIITIDAIIPDFPTEIVSV